MKLLGRVASIHRYPVKSMAGERCSSADLTFQGIPGDRMYAFIQDGNFGPFPWLTGRELPALLYYQPEYTAEERPRLFVRTPGGDLLPVESEELREELERASDCKVHLLSNYRGSFDVAPITLMAHATVDAIARESGTAADPLRFRMNLYLDTGDETPFVENGWVGGVVRVGSARIAVTEPDRRCVMTTLDYPTSEGSPRVLKAIGQLNDAFAGAYGAIITPGAVNPGDEAWLE
jgi:hypothetical protein